MPSDSIPSANLHPAHLTSGSNVIRLGGIGIILLCVAGTFLYLGGWLTPNELTPARFADEFERVDGIHSGFRLNHAKGLGVSGFFESNGQGARLSRAAIFQMGRVPVIGRFSLSGGDPYVADAPDTVRGLGLRFALPDGEEWRTAMINLPVFPVNTPQGFFDRMVAAQPDPMTHKPDPEKMAAFLANHPETVQAGKILKGFAMSSGFDNSTFNSLNAFRFVDASGASIPCGGRWCRHSSLKPRSAPGPAQGDKNYLFYALIASISQHPLQWHLIVTLGQPGDRTDDASIPWPEGRVQVDVGTLTLDSAESEATSPARDINFDPLMLPDGIVPSDDPLLSARSAVYSQSFTRRAGEKKEPSVISPSDTRK